MVCFRTWALLVIFGVALAAAGCASPGATVGQVLPHWAGGEPANAPEHPTSLPPYPAVHETPPTRNQPLITVTEQNKLEQELTVLRAQVTTRNEAVLKEREAEDAARKDLEARAATVQSRTDALRKRRAAEKKAREDLEAKAKAVRRPAESE